MQCQAPQRLNKDGSINQVYIDFMKKIPSPEERAKMTDDEILDWFISRRGGTREEILKCFGENYFPKWIFWLKSLPLQNLIPHCLVVDKIRKYIEETGDDKEWDTEEKYIDWLKERRWLGFENQERAFQNIYEGLIKEKLDYFRFEGSKDCYESLENCLMYEYGWGIEEKDWKNWKNGHDPSISYMIQDNYLIGGRQDHLYDFLRPDLLLNSE